MPVTYTQRNHLVRLARLLNKYAAQVDYAEVRPMSTTHITESQLRCRFQSGGHITCDCSESVTLMFRLAGLKDPNGLNYDGYGYTGDMLDHLPIFTDWAEVHEGTLIIFGPGTGTHVVMVVQPNGDNPQVYSHGSHANSAIWDLNTERTYHPGENVRLLSIADL